MIQTKAAEITARLLTLEELKGLYADDQMGDKLEPDALTNLGEQVEVLRTLCVLSNFWNAVRTIETTQHWLRYGNHTLAAGQSEISHIVSAVYHEFDERQFFQLSPERAQYFAQVKLFGDDVHFAFPSARADIQESGNCLATDRNTAAVFHLMRSVEWGLRALCGHLGLHHARRPHKSGKRDTCPSPIRTGKQC
jgi:hypothetical protein